MFLLFFVLVFFENLGGQTPFREGKIGFGGRPLPLVAESQLVSIFFGHLKTEISFDTEADSLLLNFFLATHSLHIKHVLDETESNIQCIASWQGNIGRSETEPYIILYGRNQLDVGQGQVQ